MIRLRDVALAALIPLTTLAAPAHADGIPAPRSGALYTAFYLPYQVREAEERIVQKAVGGPSTSSETVTAWTSAVVLGGPSSTRTAVDQWVATAYFLGRR